jgi:hypothetical protein
MYSSQITSDCAVRSYEKNTPSTPYILSSNINISVNLSRVDDLAYVYDNGVSRLSIGPCEDANCGGFVSFKPNTVPGSGVKNILISVKDDGIGGCISIKSDINLQNKYSHTWEAGGCENYGGQGIKCCNTDFGKILESIYPSSMKYYYCIPSCPSQESVKCGSSLGNGSCPGYTCSGKGTKCSAGKVCENNVCVSQKNPVLYRALWRNKTGVIWKVYNGTRINMTVTGKDLKDETINYTIYNSSNKIVASYLHGTYNSTFDYFGWTPRQPGKYNFSAKIISTGQLKRSGNLNVYSPESGCTTDCDDHSVGDEEFYCWTGTNANKIMKKKCVPDGQCEKWDISVNKTCNTTAGETCEDNDGEPRCRGPDEEEHEFCGDYNETECCDDGDNVAIEEINNIIFADSDYDEMPEDGFCGTDNPINLEPTIENGCFYYAENCTCEWNTDENKCITKYDQHRACDDEDDCPVECSYISTNVNNDCDNSGFIIYTVIAGEPESIGENCEPLEETCDDVVEQYPCASAEKLPFFNTIQLIISIVLIACIYLIFLKKFKH